MRSQIDQFCQNRRKIIERSFKNSLWNKKDCIENISFNLGIPQERFHPLDRCQWGGEMFYTSHFFNTGDLSIRPLTLHITTHLWPSLWQSKDVSLSHNVLQLPHHSISSHSRAYETISPGEIKLCLPKARYNELFNVASPLKPKFTKLVLFSVSKVSVTPFWEKKYFLRKISLYSFPN